MSGGDLVHVTHADLVPLHRQLARLEATIVPRRELEAWVRGIVDERSHQLRGDLDRTADVALDVQTIVCGRDGRNGIRLTVRLLQDAERRRDRRDWLVIGGLYGILFSQLGSALGLV